MKRYESYKDSGVQWLGKIPIHWGVKRLASAFVENRTLNIDLDSTDAYKFNYGTLVRKDEDITNKDVLDTYRKYTLIEPNDILINGLNLNYDFVSQRVAISKNRGIITSAYLAITPREMVNPNYFCFFLKAMDSKKMFHGMGTGIRLTLSFSELKKQFVLFPPIEEQKAIVAFLDDNTARIDDLVAQVESEIELLKEYKQAEIARVVTKGLNPNAPMRPSGISWIGDIPEHWETRKLSQIADEYFVSNNNIHHQNLLSLSYGAIVRKDINATDGLLPASFDTYQVVKNGIIILRLTDLQNDHKSLRVGIAKEEGIVTSAYTSLKARPSIIPNYLYYQLHVNDIHKVFYGMGGGLRQSLNFAGMKGLLTVLPPLSEQQEIVDYIDSKTAEIDRLVAELNNQVEHLKEYKQRLIADVVTGKINVLNN